MGNLLSAFNSMEKTARQHAQNGTQDIWERGAAANGMSVNQYMDKVAELQVARELEMVKMAKADDLLGQYYALGYWDEMTKVACADPVRDGVPEIFIKIAQQAKINMVFDLLKVAAGEEAAAKVVEEAAKDPSWISKVLTSTGGRIADASRAAWGGVKRFGARQLANLQRALNFGEVGGINKAKQLYATEGGSENFTNWLTQLSHGNDASTAALDRSRLGAAGRLALESGLPLAGLAGTGAYLASR